MSYHLMIGTIPISLFYNKIVYLQAFLKTYNHPSLLTTSIFQSLNLTVSKRFRNTNEKLLGLP